MSKHDCPLINGKLYIVYSSQGSYSDYREFDRVAFLTKEEAETECEIRNERFWLSEIIMQDMYDNDWYVPYGSANPSDYPDVPDEYMPRFLELAKLAALSEWGACDASIREIKLQVRKAYQ